MGIIEHQIIKIGDLEKVVISEELFTALQSFVEWKDVSDIFYPEHIYNPYQAKDSGELSLSENAQRELDNLCKEMDEKDLSYIRIVTT